MTSRRASEAEGVQLVSRQVLSQLYFAFALMSIIPLLICCFLITVKFFSISILVGVNGLWLLLAVGFAILGLISAQFIIRHIIQQLVDANSRLARFQLSQAAFVSNVAHEFRAPLAVIKGSIDNLADGLHGAITAEQREPLTMSQRELGRLKRLIGDLLDISQIEAGKFRLMPGDVTLQDVLLAVTQSFGALFKDRHLTLTVNLPNEPVRLAGDRDRLSQVFMNLIGNAMKFTEQGGVTVRLAQTGGIVQVEVADTGRGIPPPERARLFNRFERAPGSTTTEGVGLGLAIAKAIVDLHHGRIRVESRVGEGSRFFVSLPVQGGTAA